jgi:hypothetical protein
MMESLADQLRNVPLEAAIECAGETITVLFRPFALEVAAFRATPERERTRAMVDDLLERVLVSWDRARPDGSPLPLDREAFATLPPGFRAAMLARLAIPEQRQGPPADRPPRRKRSH